MIYLLAAVLLSAVGVVIWWSFMRKDSNPPEDTYICDQCGERDCICRKEEHVS